MTLEIIFYSSILFVISYRLSFICHVLLRFYYVISDLGNFHHYTTRFHMRLVMIPHWLILLWSTQLCCVVIQEILIMRIFWKWSYRKKLKTQISQRIPRQLKSTWTGSNYKLILQSNSFSLKSWIIGHPIIYNNEY